MAKKKQDDFPKINEEKIIKKTTEELLNLLGVEGTFDLSQTEDGLEIILDTKDSGIVIGYHGEILESLQLVLSLCISKKIGRFVRVSLEIDGYKKNRSDWLKNLAQQTKEKVLLEHKEISLSGLKSWERRIVHLFFQDDKEAMSESIGEGKERTLVIKPR